MLRIQVQLSPQDEQRSQRIESLLEVIAENSSQIIKRLDKIVETLEPAKASTLVLTFGKPTPQIS